MTPSFPKFLSWTPAPWSPYMRAALMLFPENLPLSFMRRAALARVVMRCLIVTAPLRLYLPLSRIPYMSYLNRGSMARRPCLHCKRLTSNPSRCDTCAAAWQAQRDRNRGSAHQRGYTSAYRRQAAQVLAEHRARQGEWCPGWRVPGHTASDLTVDHVIPLARGGTHDRANLSVLCRGCNSRKRDAM